MNLLFGNNKTTRVIRGYNLFYVALSRRLSIRDFEHVTCASDYLGFRFIIKLQENHEIFSFVDELQCKYTKNK